MADQRQIEVAGAGAVGIERGAVLPAGPVTALPRSTTPVFSGMKSLMSWTKGSSRAGSPSNASRTTLSRFSASVRSLASCRRVIHDARCRKAAANRPCAGLARCRSNVRRPAYSSRSATVGASRDARRAGTPAGEQRDGREQRRAAVASVGTIRRLEPRRAACPPGTRAPHRQREAGAVPHASSRTLHARSSGRPSGDRRRAPCGCRSRPAAAPRYRTSRRTGRSSRSAPRAPPKNPDSVAIRRSHSSDAFTRVRTGRYCTTIAGFSSMRSRVTAAVSARQCRRRVHDEPAAGDRDRVPGRGR